MRTPDEAVRPQIEAIKALLAAEGLADVDDPRELQLKVFDRNRHTIRATFKRTARFLRLDYGWLSDHPKDAVAWLQEREIAKSLKAGDYDITIHAKGTIEAKL